ncbi:hypothetical protein OPV22_004791 [Ensete ventricosum]|uniref:Uncharacterized protein n=1 Tax=Ensete ventricosum TaxID=4639 RepID=A0AAV8RBE5_ENSVE|nr:hypothetical protein OPV22_004791 [Ensete ventricosum]
MHVAACDAITSYQVSSCEEEKQSIICYDDSDCKLHVIVRIYQRFNFFEDVINGRLDHQATARHFLDGGKI